MKKLFNKIVVLLIIISLFFVSNIKINAETLYQYNKCPSGTFTWYYTSKNNKESVNIVFIPNSNSTVYKWSANTTNAIDSSAIWNDYTNNYTGVRTFSLYVNMKFIRQGKVDFGSYSCLTPTFNSYDSTYEITSMQIIGSGNDKKLVVEGYAFTLTKNGSKIHNVNPTIKLNITNYDYIYLKESEFNTSAKNTYLKRCTYYRTGKYYRCPKDSYKIYENSVNEAIKFNQADANRVNLYRDYSYTRYYALDWSVGNFSLRDNSTPGKLEYFRLFNLNENDYVNEKAKTTNSGNIGYNLKKNGSNATKADVINYFLDKGYKFYINGNFKFYIPINSLIAGLSKSVTPTESTPMTSLKINLSIYDTGGVKKVYGKDVAINYVNSNITQVGVMQDATNDIGLTADTKISFKTITANTRIKFLNVSTMRGRQETGGQIVPYTVNEKSPYFANTYGNNTIYHDAKGSGNYYYYVADIIKNNNYYPINLYGLQVRTSVKNSTNAQTVYCTSANNDDGVPCMRPASQDSIDNKFSTKIYALGTWITPISVTNFKIGCKDGFTLFEDSCCLENNIINKYNTDQKTCCATSNIVTNYSTNVKECCLSGKREVYTRSGKINLCNNICPNITCPANTQKDIKGKCCSTKDSNGNYTIDPSTGECSTENEVAVEDGTGNFCKMSEMGGTCKCKPLEEEYTCKVDSSSSETTPVKIYKVRLIKSNNKTTCSEKYIVTFNKEVSVLQGGYFNYPVGLKVIRECSGGGVTRYNLPSYVADTTITKTAEADIYLKKVSANAEQTTPTLLEHAMANLNKKEYSIVFDDDSEKITQKESIVKQEIDYKLVEYKYNYYLNTFTGKIRDAALGISDGYLPSGKYVYILLNAPIGKYKNDVLLNIHGNTIKINCSYEIKENVVQKYTYRQFDTDKVFARSKIGNNWKTETAQRIITKIQNSGDEVYEEGRAMYEINLDSDSINKIKTYIDSNGYYNTELRSDGTSKFIYETFNTNISINRNENILKDIID